MRAPARGRRPSNELFVRIQYDHHRDRITLFLFSQYHGKIRKAVCIFICKHARTVRSKSIRGKVAKLELELDATLAQQVQWSQ